MRLSHRVSLLIGSLLLIVLTTLLMVTVHNSRIYLNQQLSSHAQDTATALGLALSTALAEGDQAALDSMTSAIFDRGDYTRIRVEDNHGEALFERHDALRIDGIPDWFMRWLPLDAPRRSAKVMHGWRQSGRIIVQSHPGYAYLQLWENSREAILWIGLIGVFSISLGLLILRGLMAPLNQLEAQADAICRREFPEVNPLPRTPELARIVVAMNRMSHKVKEIIGNLETLAGKLRTQAYRHPVSGLANKRHFIDVLNDFMSNADKTGRGALILVQLQDFKGYNQRHGYPAGDTLLREFAQRLDTLAATQSNCLVGHLSGADFALLAEDMEYDACTALVASIAGSLSDLRYFEWVDSLNIAHVGGVIFDRPSDTGELLARADDALRTAHAKGPNAVHLELLANTAPGSAKSASQQRHEIQQAIEQQQLSCLLQPVVRCPDKQLLHYEVLARLRLSAPETNAEEVLNAGRFVPMAASIGLGSQIDRSIIQHAFDLLSGEQHAEHRLAVNITPSSLDDPTFVPWLSALSRHQPHVAGRLALEMPEFGLEGRISAVRDLVDELHRNGGRFGLDRYGRTEQSITNLKALKLDHIKIDGAFVQSLDKRDENQFFIRALADMARGLDIEVLVEAVESESVWQLLDELDVQGAQGYYLGHPA